MHDQPGPAICQESSLAGKPRFPRVRCPLALAAVATAIGSFGVATGLLLGIPLAGIVFLRDAIKAAAIVTAASLYLEVDPLACIVVATGLSLEYLACLWGRRRSAKLTAFQFTLAELMAAVTLAAMVLSLTKVLGPAAYLCLGIAMVLMALVLRPLGDPDQKTSRD